MLVVPSGEATALACGQPTPGLGMSRPCTQTRRPKWFRGHVFRVNAAICLCNGISCRDVVCYKYVRFNQTSRAADVIYFGRNFNVTHVSIDFRSILTGS